VRSEQEASGDFGGRVEATERSGVVENDEDDDDHNGDENNVEDGIESRWSCIIQSTLPRDFLAGFPPLSRGKTPCANFAAREFARKPVKLFELRDTAII